MYYYPIRQYGKTYHAFHQDNLKTVTLFEKFLLLFKKPFYITDTDGNIISTIKYKRMFNKLYIISHKYKLVKMEEE